MSREKYTRVQSLLPEIRAMEAAGKSKREIAEYLGLRDKYVVKQLLSRENRKERQIKEGLLPRPKKRPQKESPEAELLRLRMENQLLRDFLGLTERK